MKKIILKIEGMTCSACSSGLEKFLNKQEGIIQASVNLVMSNALIEYDESVINLNKIENFIKKAGFKSLGIYDNKIEESKSNKEKIEFVIFRYFSCFINVYINGPYDRSSNNRFIKYAY